MLSNYFRNPKNRKLEKPRVVQFPVIDICNSGCQMCNIWKNKKNDAITVETVRKGFSGPLFSEVRSIGINGGEPTLRSDLPQLVDALFDVVPKLKYISLITNSYNTPVVKKRIEELGDVVRKRGGYFDVMISLDGVGEVHDRVRGKPGNFARAVEVLDYAKSLTTVSNVRVGCTIIKENINGMHDLLDFCRRRDVYVKFRVGIPHQRLYSDHLTEPFALSVEDRYNLAEFLKGLCTHYETSPMQKYFYRSLIDQILFRAPRKAGCDWQYRGVTVTAEGELLYCAVKSDAFGKIGEGDNLSEFKAAEPMLRRICQESCDSCVHDYVGIPDFKGILQIVREKFAMKLKRKLPLIFAIRESAWLKYFARHILYRKHSLNFRKYFLAPKANTPKNNILVIGWYGTETLGDKAILGGVLQQIEKLKTPETSVHLMSYNPYLSHITMNQLGPDKAKVISLSHACAQIDQYKYIVFGGGPIMAIRETIDMSLIFAEGKKRGATTIIAGCGVGPFGHPYVNKHIKNLLSNADVRVYRDEDSRKSAGRIGINVSKDVVSVDPAFNWLSTFSDLKYLNRPESNQKIIALGLRDFPYEQYAYSLGVKKGRELRDKVATQLTEIVTKLIDRGHRLMPIPMCTNSFGDDDRFFYRRLFLGLSEAQLKSIDFRFLYEELAPELYVKGFYEADLALTMRFHSLVFAIATERPVIAIDYTLGKGKVFSLAKRFSAPSYSLDQIDSGEIVDAVERELRSDNRTKNQGAKFELEVGL